MTPMRTNTEVFVFFALSLILGFNSVSAQSRIPYQSIFNLGDSLSDTGNYLAVGAPGFPFIGNFPYGETFGQPTGRSSDGRLVIDFLAEAFGLPLLEPYLKVAQGPYVRTGVNFAVFGATALDSEFFYANNLGGIVLTNDSLSVQVGWFKQWKAAICTTKQECDRYFRTSLILMGEIGGNDYNLPMLFAGLTIEQVRPFVPLVIEAIINATSALIEEGVVNIVVPGNFPIGCIPALLTRFQSSNQSDYDPQTGCLRALNDFSMYHNRLLVQALVTLRHKYPRARIMYADNYGASSRFYQAPNLYGFSGGVLTACCGGGGPYNFNPASVCGLPTATVCADPSTFASWDGVHWTEAAYHVIADGLINGPFVFPPLA